MKRYFIDCDDDGHYYIIPLDKRSEWEEASYDWDVPDYATSIDGSPSWISFTDWKQES